MSDLHAVKSGRLLRGLAQYYRLVAGGDDDLSSQNDAFANSASSERVGFGDLMTWAS